MDYSHQLVPKRYGRQGLNDSQRQTVDQRADSLSIASSKDTWIVNPCSTGYFIPAGNDPLIVRYGKQTTPSSFGLTEQGMGTMTAAKAYLLHGAKPAQKKYQFLVVPATTAERMRADAKRFVRKGGIFEVKQQQDSFAHREAHTFAHNRIRFVCPCHRAE